MSEVVSYQLKDNIGVISVNNPPVNALAQAVREGILNAINTANEDASEAILLVCEGRTFVAGADITEFGKPPKDPGFPLVLDAIENASKPVIAAIHGTALGGGFELALACHYRCALPTAKVGLPEVKLGLLPGAGGTQRVPRLTGVKAALDMITSGNPISASKALKMTLVDKIIEGDNLELGGIQYAKELIGSSAPLKRISDIKIDPATVEPGFFDNARKHLARRARGQIAQDRIVSCIEAAVELPMGEGLERERELFRELVASPESAAMRHIFFSERQAAKIQDLPKGAPVRDIKKVAIIGGGTMGGGIAMCFANVGIPVVMLEINDDALQRGMGIIRKNYNITVLTALFFGFVGAWDGAGNLPFTVTFADAARLVRKCVEAPLENLTAQNEFLLAVHGGQARNIVLHECFLAAQSVRRHTTFGGIRAVSGL